MDAKKLSRGACVRAAALAVSPVRLTDRGFSIRLCLEETEAIHTGYKRLKQHSLRLAIVGLIILAFVRGAHGEDQRRYLAFQFFPASGSPLMRQFFFSQPKDLHTIISELKDQIGVTGTDNRHLGFILGPLAFDNTDEQVRELIASGFDTALKTGVAVGFHIDDSMFWGRLKELNTPENIEWLDWSGAPSGGRGVKWDPPKRAKLLPPLCLNSTGVQNAVRVRAILIGNEIAKGILKLREAGAEDLFIGVIAGWETQIGRDFDTWKTVGYCALTNAGYSKNKPPVDIDAARSQIVRTFIGLWAQALTEAGVPRGKVYSHLPLDSEKEASSAFCSFCVPGVSTYPFPGFLDMWRKELAKHGNPPWASSEGTAMDPREARHAGRGIGMEGYLGSLFNHGAVLVNVFGWGLGDESNPFRQISEGSDALAAYRKFLNGEKLGEAQVPDLLSTLPENLRIKIQKVQAALPGWLQNHEPAQIQDNIHILGQALEDQRLDDAEKTTDSILKIIGK